MNPIVGAAKDFVGTTISPRASQPGTFKGLYTTDYNKNMPKMEQYKQIASSMGIQLAPLPAPFLVHDVLHQVQTGRGVAMDSTHVEQYLSEALGLGQITVKESDAVKHAARSADNELERQMGNLRKRQNGANPLNPDEAAALANKYAQEYSARQATLYDRVRRKTGALPAGLTPVSLPSGLTPIR
jgi:hypothetical protein